MVIDKARDRYEEMAFNSLYELKKQYENAVRVFMTAPFAYGVIEVAEALPRMLRDAEFFGWHESKADTCRTFCHLCCVDPALVEAYLGIRFDKLFSEVA